MAVAARRHRDTSTRVEGVHPQELKECILQELKECIHKSSGKIDTLNAR